MNAVEAQRFEIQSERNAAIVEDHFTCDCRAYQDIFTYGRWKAQSLQVQKGQKACKILTCQPIIVTDDDTGDKKVVGTRPRTSAVFCRHQVA